MVGLLLGCFIGFVTAMTMYVPTDSRKGQAIATPAVAPYTQKLETADPHSDRPPCEQRPVLPSNIDYSLVESTETSFWWDNGSFVLRYHLEDGDKLEIVMVGPDYSPDEDPPGYVLWALNPNCCEDYSKLSQDEILKFISRRLKIQTNMSTEEAGYLSTLLVYSQRLVRLKRWGICRHFAEGEWYKVFERPERATFGNSRDSDRSQSKE